MQSTQREHIATRPTTHPLLFLQQFLKHPRQIASITPSSRFVERRIVRLGHVAAARTVVELGAGSGGTTQAILDAMPASARLLAIEINPRFCELLPSLHDRRLVVHGGGAHELRDALARHGLARPDTVISGVPFSTMSHATASSIIDMIWTVLAPGGRFVAYQMRDMVDRLSRARFGPPQVEYALLNVPPLRVYGWRKSDAPRPVAIHEPCPASAASHALGTPGSRARSG